MANLALLDIEPCMCGEPAVEWLVPLNTWAWHRPVCRRCLQDAYV